MTDSLPVMKRPPVHEVVCGVVFAPIQQITPVAAGQYWETRRDVFSSATLQPAAKLQGVAIGLLPPLRTWLEQRDPAFLVQIQNDRFYLNWRKRGANYPRFGQTGAQSIKAKLLTEFTKFGEFCRERFGVEPAVRAIELAKINVIRSGTDWQSYQDLAEVFRPLGGLKTLLEASSPGLVTQFTGKTEAGQLSVKLELGTEQSSDSPALKFELRVEAPCSSDFPQAFDLANNKINQVFAQMIPRTVMEERFQ